MSASRPGTLLLSLLTLPFLACAQDLPPVVDLVGEAQHIRALEAGLSATVARGDRVGFASFFAEDAVQMPPNMPPRVGREAIEGATRFVEGESLTLDADHVGVASAGDMAFARGTYLYTMETPDGVEEDRGSFVEVWRKIDGEWKITADIFHSDLPPR